MSKVILKMSFKHPNLKSSAGKNVSHLEYIACRPGVDKSISEEDLLKELEKGMSENENYVDYINSRPLSHGLFGQEGIEDLEGIQSEIDNKTSCVWRAIISLNEDDAKDLGYLNKEVWQDMLRKKVPDMADKMGIPFSNLRWVGAVHMERGHPHAHIMIWEKKSQLLQGIVKSNVLNKIRKDFTDEIFEKERLEILLEKNATRDLLRDLAKHDMSYIANTIKGAKIDYDRLKTADEITCPKLYLKDEKILTNMVEELIKLLPNKGRVAFKYMPEDTKEQIKKIGEFLTGQTEFKALIARNMIAVENLTRLYTTKEIDIERAKANALNDINKRLHQMILKGAVEATKSNSLIVDDIKAINSVNFIKNLNTGIIENTISNNDDKSIEKLINSTVEKLATILIVSKLDIEGVKDIIYEWNIKSGTNLDETSLDNIINKSNGRFNDNNIWNKTTIISKEEWNSLFKHLGISDKDIPEWIYKVDFTPTQNVGLHLFKDFFKALQRNKQQLDNEAEFLSRTLTKKQQLESKAVRKEQSQYGNDELEFN